MRSFAIVPAAGESRRMGTPKLLLPWQGKPLIAHALEAWQAGGVNETIVVVRPEDEPLAEIARSCGAQVVVPDRPPPHMLASIRYGVAHIEDHFTPTQRDVWLVAPADLPRLSAAVIARLISEHAVSPDDALIPTLAARRGHPVLLPWPWTKRLSSLGPDQGLNALVAAGPTREVPCDTLADPATLADIDTPDDYAAL